MCLPEVLIQLKLSVQQSIKCKRSCLLCPRRLLDEIYSVDRFSPHVIASRYDNLSRKQLANPAVDIFWGHAHEDHVSVSPSEPPIHIIFGELDIDLLHEQCHSNEH